MKWVIAGMLLCVCGCDLQMLYNNADRVQDVIDTLTGYLP